MKEPVAVFRDILAKILPASKGPSKYKKLSVLGRGSMSVVYLVSEGGSLYALKVLSPKARDLERKLSERYRSGKSEGEIAASFDHPGLVKTYAWGAPRSGPWMLMEHLEGDLLKARMGALGERIRQGDLYTVIAMAESLQYMHDRGYIHRDVCPRNIFVMKDGSPKTFDFGLTVEIEKARQLQGNRTGTSSYMAPELIRRLRTDQRTDIYSFGVMLYELATGRRPIETEGALERLVQLLNVPFASPREVNPEVDQRLSVVILQAVAKKVEERYESFNDLIADLRKIHKGPDMSTPLPVGISYSREMKSRTPIPPDARSGPFAPQ